jgi:hypothetical protein
LFVLDEWSAQALDEVLASPKRKRHAVAAVALQGIMDGRVGFLDRRSRN